MAKAVIAYDRELPEIPGRRPWERPTSFLVKDPAESTGWREDTSGRRSSPLLLIPKIRTSVDAWRDASYPGASTITRRLFEYWFEEDHMVFGFPVPFRYYFCQREAIETLAWLVEIAGITDVQDLIRSFVSANPANLFDKGPVFQTTMDGQRQLRRYVKEMGAEAVQNLPPQDLRRYAFKMATGSGKTWVMAMAIVWSHFHRRTVAGSPLAANFLIVAPNIIVYERLAKDFANNSIFSTLPLVPPEWGKFAPKVILRGEATEPDASGNLFLTNVQQLYESRDQEWTPQNAVEAMLGRAPSKDLASSGQRSMLERLKSLKDLLVLNDEAHHVHDDELAWNQSLLAIHNALPKGIAAWLDFSATPKDQNGMYFPWTVCDYPLAQAVEDRIVKAPLIVDKKNDPKRPLVEPEGINRENVIEKYNFWIEAAVKRWQEHTKAYEKHLGKKPVLFVTAEKNVYADAIGAHLIATRKYGLKADEVLVIHTDLAGEITKGDLDDARDAARDIDKPDSKIRAIVSVMMLREGWDVRNVTVVLGLRPFTAKSEILPEQVIGRGLRIMNGVSPDRTQTLEVLGTQRLLEVLRDQLEAEGVGVTTTHDDPPSPVIIEPVRERLAFDIAIPITKPTLVREIRKLENLDPTALEPIWGQAELDRAIGDVLRLEFMTTETEVHLAEITPSDARTPQELLAAITNKVVSRAGLPNRFAEVYPIIRDYVTNRCFGRQIDLDDAGIRQKLGQYLIQEGIAKYLAREISNLTVVRQAIEFERANNKLSDTTPFSWRRNLPPLALKKTIFNYVATFNNFEREFAEFLDMAPDVHRFAALGTTQQGDSGTQFRVDYLKTSGAIGFYHPDWVLVQRVGNGEVNWIVETKGQVWENTDRKDEAMALWCERVAAATGQAWHFTRINQSEVNFDRGSTFAELVAKKPGLM